MANQVVIPVLISFVLSLVLGPVVIPFLRKLKMGQTERVEGVQSHLKKAGTPTMGGVIILASVIITSLFYVKDNPKIIPVLFLTVGFGLIGFLDDYLKVVMKRSDGLYPKQKMGSADRGNRHIRILYCKGCKNPADTFDPVLGWEISGSWDFCGSVAVCCRDRNSQRYEFYRWSGRSCIQRYRAGRYIFYRGRSGNKERDRTDHLCGCRCIDGISSV